MDHLEQLYIYVQCHAYGDLDMYGYGYIYTALVSVCVCVGLFGGHLDERRGGEGLGSLYGQSEGTVPDQGTEHSQSTRHAKQHSVETHLRHAVVLGEGGEEREKERKKK